MKQIKTLSDAVAWRMCIGCGVCAHACPEDWINLYDFVEEGIRPVQQMGKPCQSCSICLDVCPAVSTDFGAGGDEAGGGQNLELERKWGPVLGVWEGFATDREVRYKGSSGGVLTAIAAYCLEEQGMHGVLHTAQDPEEPVRNRTRLSRSKEDLLAATGSRYSPGSVGNGLDLVAEAPAACVVIGKPSEIAGVSKARKQDPVLDEKIGLTLSFFCAESPSTRGTLALLEQLEVDEGELSDLRYRGNGWPGHFAPVLRGEKEPRRKLTYQESWSFLQAYRPWAVNLWPDGSGELADISCGDPWYEQPDGQNPGISIVVARTKKGKEIVEAAIDAGYLSLQPIGEDKIEASQRGLLFKKGAVWGRLIAMSMMGIPRPDFRGTGLFRCWLSIPFEDKLRSVFGTFRRIVARGLRRKLKLDHESALPVKSAFDVRESDPSAKMSAPSAAHLAGRRINKSNPPI